jgi:DNA-binding response OmpR family regulator
MRAVLRRTRTVPATGGQPHATQPESSDPGQRLRIDRRARRVLRDGKEIALAPKEYDLLALLSDEPGALFTREQIMEAVWDENWFGSTKTLDVHVGALRRKLGDAVTIEAVRGVGFRLTTRRSSASSPPRMCCSSRWLSPASQCRSRSP